VQELQLDHIATPIGTLLLVADGAHMCSLDFADEEPSLLKLLQKRYGQVRLQPTTNPSGFSDLIRRYFAGDYRSIEAIPVSTGGTPFQQQIWHELRTIPPGTTATYGEIAAKVGRPRAYRAIGATNACNPIVIVIPCHRVIGADASLTGYGPGLARKQWLLQHEGTMHRLNGSQQHYQ